ncbi:MAG: asparagine synthase (glutamine-hydrolyzing), partial [Anaerolineae bacterium]
MHSVLAYAEFLLKWETDFMCGIAGQLDLTGRGRADFPAIRRMCDAIAHRGPDGDGYYDDPGHNAALGMRRLSIIDVDGSDQPLYNEDRSIAMVFNGEIYNYRELRQLLIEQGHAPDTEGDGETVIHLYEQYGIDGMFRLMRGMYAFALWDTRHQRLVLAVDHIGIKPLYVHQRDGFLWFSSEVKAMIAAGVPASMNAAVLDTYLSFGYMIGEETLFEGITRLMPGHVLIAENGAVRTERYWKFPFFTGAQHAAPLPMTDEVSLIAEARERLDESIRLHLRSDVPLGLFLSGGIDSAAVLGIMSRFAGTSREVGDRVKTYTIGYDADTPDNELHHARRIAAHFGTDHHERIITADDWWKGFERYVYHHDEPNANSSAVSLLLLSELTGAQVKVVLTGLGGDELFGGYPNHRAIPALLAQQARYGSWARPFARLIDAVEPLYPSFKRYRYIGALPTYLPRWRAVAAPRDEAIRRLQSFDGLVFSDTLRRKLYSPRLIEAWQSAQHKERTFASILADSQRDNPDDFAQAIVANTWLHGNALLHGDKVTMAYSLEARVPFFDPDLIAFAARVPGTIRMKSSKYVLREAMRPYLPEFALERPKQPFSTPILHWFGGALSDRIQGVLRDPAAFIRQWM